MWLPEMQTLYQLTVQLGVTSHVSFHGRIPWSESLFRLYKESDLFLMASTSEGASRTLIEAMAVGLPAISTEVGIAPELLDPRVLVKVNNEVEYAQKLISVAIDPVLMTYLSKQNWQRSQDFRLSKLKLQREAFYAKAIELSSRYPLS
jgi:glycosyltransferase involved in cell wall biosynthesis